ncbi:MAG: ATP-binding protein [candidate division FCPU426 bacterium]
MPLVQTSNPAILSYQELAAAFQRLNRITDFGQLSNHVLAELSRLFEVEAAALLLVNKHSQELEIAAVREVPEEILTAYLQHPARAQAVAEAMVDHNLGVDDSNCPEQVRSLAAAGLNHFRLFPILLEENIIGYCALASSRPVCTTPEQQAAAPLVLAFVAQAIENAYFIYQLKQQNARLEHMMTRLQNTQNHLKRAEKMALVGKIAATVAHEIRNPLTVISTNLQLVHDKLPSDHPEHELYATMLAKVRGLDQTIKEMLVLARPLQLNPRPLALPATLERVLVFVERKFAARNLKVSLEVPEQLPAVLLDEEQAQRVFLNLLLNAYQFLPEGGRIRVHGAHQAGDPWVTLSFSDDGPGIESAHLPQIFEPFFTTRTDGTGLGLFLVKHILEEMNSSIEVASAVNAGTEFRLRLPVAK